MEYAPFDPNKMRRFRIKLISGNQWTILFRCRIDDYLLEGNPAWVWNTVTDTSKAANQREIRIGFGRNPNNSSDKKNYVKLCLGQNYPALTDLCVETNEWLEVAVVVDGRAEAHTIRASLARPNDVRWYRDYTVPYDHDHYTTNFYLGNVWLGGPNSGATTSNKVNFRGNLVSFQIRPEDEVFRNGENIIVLDFLPSTRTDGKNDWVSPDMIAIEPLRPKSPFFLIVR